MSHLAEATLLLLAMVSAAVPDTPGTITGDPWPRHVIDASSQGADGARLRDVNGDGLLDIATAWEEGGLIRAYLHPGTKQLRSPWPAVSVGRVPAPEDAVFADLDGDGAFDVVSCSEGQSMTLWFHWAPAGPNAYGDAEAWETAPLPASQGKTRWMFCLPLQLDGKHGCDLVAGSKNPNAQVGWFEAPADPRDVAAWRYHRIFDASWIMSLLARDMDDDGDADILISDRKAPESRGCWWLQNPGPGNAQEGPWAAHLIGGKEHEVMFMAPWDAESRNGHSLIAATRGGPLLRFSREDEGWSTTAIPLPPDTGTGKSVAAGDLDGDGDHDVVFSCENAGGKQGIVWLEQETSQTWPAHAVSGRQGAKFDLLSLYDFDGDGDLDVLTCEERENLGVIWYENPTRQADSTP